MTLLEVKNLTIGYGSKSPAVKNVSFSLERGQILSLVGESGSGKTTVIRGILGLLSGTGRITDGELRFDGTDLRALSKKQMQHLRGRDIAMIFQDAGLAMDPIVPIGKQFVEYIQVHQDLADSAAKELACEWLSRMNLDDPHRVMESYPFELSGGMKQRAAIAMAMAQNPKLLLADEPTSALDVTVQAQVVRELQKLTEEYGTAIILVTHNMGVASYLSDQIAVMKTGEIVEYGSRDQVIFHPESDYTKMLLSSVPKLELAERMAASRNRPAGGRTSVCYRRPQGICRQTEKAQGCRRCGWRGFPPVSGRMSGDRRGKRLRKKYAGPDDHRQLSAFRRTDCAARQTDLGDEPEGTAAVLPPCPDGLPESDLVLQPADDDRRIPVRTAAKLRKTIQGGGQETHREIHGRRGASHGLSGPHPHELSGGQLQRVVIARAALLEPELIVCDEATSALDVSIQNQVADMLVDLQGQEHLSYMFHRP